MWYFIEPDIQYVSIGESDNKEAFGRNLKIILASLKDENGICQIRNASILAVAVGYKQVHG